MYHTIVTSVVTPKKSSKHHVAQGLVVFNVFGDYFTYSIDNRYHIGIEIIYTLMFRKIGA